MSPSATSATPARLALAFAALYAIWGSTYLAIRVAVVEFDPFVMASLRFLAAGACLYGFLRLRGAPAPTRREWRNAACVGFLLLACANGAVTWAEQTVPSGLAALLCAVLPMWMVLLDWVLDRRQRPTLRVLFGVLLGIAGVAVLIGPGLRSPDHGVDLVGCGVIVLGSLAWAMGSLASRKLALPKSALMATAMEMLAGGAVLAVVALALGGFARFEPSALSLKAWLCLAYLAVFGSLVALTAYIWLLQVSTPARVSTYAYVNPVVAVLLGWALLDEELNWRTAIAAAIIVVAVAVIITQRARAAATAPAAPGRLADELVPSEP